MVYVTSVTRRGVTTHYDRHGRVTRVTGTPTSKQSSSSQSSNIPSSQTTSTPQKKEYEVIYSPQLDAYRGRIDQKTLAKVTENARQYAETKGSDVILDYGAHTNWQFRPYATGQETGTVAQRNITGGVSSKFSKGSIEYAYSTGQAGNFAANKIQESTVEKKESSVFEDPTYLAKLSSQYKRKEIMGPPAQTKDERFSFNVEKSYQEQFFKPAMGFELPIIGNPAKGVYEFSKSTVQLSSAASETVGNVFTGVPIAGPFISGAIRGGTTGVIGVTVGAPYYGVEIGGRIPYFFKETVEDPFGYSAWAVSSTQKIGKYAIEHPAEAAGFAFGAYAGTTLVSNLAPKSAETFGLSPFKAERRLQLTQLEKLNSKGTLSFEVTAKKPGLTINNVQQFDEYKQGITFTGQRYEGIATIGPIPSTSKFSFMRSIDNFFLKGQKQSYPVELVQQEGTSAYAFRVLGKDRSILGFGKDIKNVDQLVPGLKSDVQSGYFFEFEKTGAIGDIGKFTSISRPVGATTSVSLSYAQTAQNKALTFGVTKVKEQELEFLFKPKITDKDVSVFPNVKLDIKPITQPQQAPFKTFSTQKGPTIQLTKTSTQFKPAPVFKFTETQSQTMTFPKVFLPMQVQKQRTPGLTVSLTELQMKFNQNKNIVTPFSPQQTETRTLQKPIQLTRPEFKFEEFQKQKQIFIPIQTPKTKTEVIPEFKIVPIAIPKFQTSKRFGSVPVPKSKDLFGMIPQAPELFGGARRRNIKIISSVQKTKYQPSLYAKVFNIKAMKMPKIITGISIRPMIMGRKNAKKKK